MFKRVYMPWFIYLWWLLMYFSELFISGPIFYWKVSSGTGHNVPVKVWPVLPWCLVLNPKVAKIFSQLSNWKAAHQLLYWHEFTSAENLGKASVYQRVFEAFPLLMGRKCHKNNRSCTIFTSSAVICQLNKLIILMGSLLWELPRSVQCRARCAQATPSCDRITASSELCPLSQCLDTKQMHFFPLAYLGNLCLIALLKAGCQVFPNPSCRSQ